MEFEIEEAIPEEQNNIALINSILSDEALNQECGGSIEVTSNDREIEETDNTSLLIRLRLRGNSKNILPVCVKDLKVRQSPGAKDLSFGDFLLSIPLSTLDIPPHSHGALLIACGTILKYLAERLNAVSDNKWRKYYSNKAEPTLVGFGEALTMVYPEMVHMMLIIVLYALTLLLLVWPLQPVLQAFILLMLIAVPLFYVPELVDKASGVAVNCGSFKLPLMWLTTSGAVILSVICVSAILIWLYLIRRYTNASRPRVKQTRDIS